MKKYIRCAAALLSATMLCSCASRENTNTIEKHWDYIGTLPDFQSGYDSVDTEADTAEEMLAPPSSENAASDTHHAELTGETQSSSEETVVIPEETSDAESEETLEDGLDEFYIDEYAAYSLKKSERAFTKDAIFVGDSICRGFEEYKVVDPDNVYARGSVAARNFYDFTMFYGDEEVSYTDVLSAVSPEYVFLSMGMNDINLTDEDVYCENYRKIIDQTLEETDAEVFVCAITPINCEFSTNYRIDCFNVKIDQFIEENYPSRVHYLDFAKHLKDSDGSLKECFNGGDGIHLSPYAYYVALWEMHREMTADGIL